MVTLYILHPNNLPITMENKLETVVEETTEELTVLKDNTLNVLPVNSTVYIPYISVVDDIYEVRECVIESIWDIVENNVITIFYNVKLTDTKLAGEKMTLNILANVSTSYEEAEKELHDFLNKQVDALTEHTVSMETQLVKNAEHIKMFKEKLK